MFGLTGIQLVDLDRDGNIDILLTNGDSFDDQYAKPSHGVQWSRISSTCIPLITIQLPRSGAYPSPGHLDRVRARRTKTGEQLVAEKELRRRITQQSLRPPDEWKDELHITNSRCLLTQNTSRESMHVTPIGC
jgi:hypothetical protein